MTTMQYADHEHGPYTVELIDDVTITVKGFDGGGMWIDPNHPQFCQYMVHGEYPDGGFAEIPQEQIVRVTDQAGVEYDFGNPYMPGHPRSAELDDDDL